MNGQRGAVSSDGDGRIGTVIAGRYRIERLIGRGGMASVYAAHDTQLRRPVALKIFRPELADGDDVRRHEGEVSMLAALNHPGLVTLFDAVSDDTGAAVLVLELVGGGDLRAAIDSRSLSHRDVAAIGAIVGDALAYSHAQGIVHRDVKPANILLPHASPGHTESPAKLADFGIARIIDETRVTAIGSVIGTAQYLSPEQALGGDVGPASDVYSLGLVLIEALGGERPFPGTGVESLAARLARDPVLPEGLSADWVSVLRGMTERDAAIRITAAAAAGLLRAAAAMEIDRGGGVPSTGEEPTALQPTLLLPATAEPSSTAVTELLGGTPAAPEMTTTPPPAPSATTTSRAPGIRRRTLAAIVVGGLIVASGGIAVGVSLAGPGVSPAPPAVVREAPDYPLVEGTIGELLEQLQRSVAP